MYPYRRWLAALLLLPTLGLLPGGAFDLRPGPVHPRPAENPEATPTSETHQATPPFALRDGDRVALLGNGLIEGAQEHGYLELALTTRWPSRDVVFRNLGWTGDRVDGEARDHHTSPPTGYEHLLEQVRAVEPTVLFVGYGQNEAFRAEPPFERFRDGLEQLLEDLASATDARLILLSPTPLEREHSPLPDPESLDEALGAVREVVEQVADERGHRFVDLYAGLQEVMRNREVPLTTDGLHLSRTGYYEMARLIEEELGLPDRGWERSVEAGTGTPVRFEHRAPRLPLVPPERIRSQDRSEAAETGFGRLRVRGLEEGGYQLVENGEPVAEHSDRRWGRGVLLTDGADAEQSRALRRAIVRKNELYWRHYRPQNLMYIEGEWNFMHGPYIIEETRQILSLVEEQERRIARLRAPNIHRYELVLAGVAARDTARIFNGRDLTGWETGAPSFFRVEDRSLVAGRLDRSIEENHFVCTKETYSDFRLRLSARVKGEGAMRNGGVQIRSRRVPGSHEVRGYQADVGWVPGRNVWGALYDEARRRKFLAMPDSAAVTELVDEGGWNDFEVRARGRRIEVFLNGTRTVDYMEQEAGIADSGVICLQIHSGPPSEIWYRDLVLTDLTD